MKFKNLDLEYLMAMCPENMQKHFEARDVFGDLKVMRTMMSYGRLPSAFVRMTGSTMTYAMALRQYVKEHLT